MKCLIEPMGTFGDHDKGLSGCLWCEMAKDCVERNPNVGDSLLFVDTPLIDQQLEIWKEEYEGIG